MSGDLTIVPIVDSSSGKVLKLQGKWKENEVRFLLNDGEGSWTGKFDLGDLDDEILSELNLGRIEYMQRMKIALGTAANDEYRFTFDDDSLSWAKIVSSGLSVRHGRIPLRPVTPSNHGELVRSLLDSYGSVLEELSDSVARYKALERDYNEINSAFEDCTRKKIEMEVSLYSKFAMVLNEKKEYVRRVTGQEPMEDFGPTQRLDDKSEERDTMSVQWGDFIKIAKRNSTAEDERPSKKTMLHVQPSTSRGSSDMET